MRVLEHTQDKLVLQESFWKVFDSRRTFDKANGKYITYEKTFITKPAVREYPLSNYSGAKIEDRLDNSGDTSTQMLQYRVVLIDKEGGIIPVYLGWTSFKRAAQDMLALIVPFVGEAK